MKRSLRMLTAALTLICSVALTSCTEPTVIEYGKVFSYTYQGQTLYYIVTSTGEASVVPPMFPYFDNTNDETWTGYDKPQGAVVIPDSVPYCNKEYPVKKLIYCAFFRCYDITDITLPSTLTFIDKHSFLFCRNLKSVVIPEGVTEISYGAFDTCESLTSVKFPSTLKTIGDWAFLSCLNVTEINLPNSVETIGQNCFTDMISLKSVTLSENLTSMGVGVFDSSTALTEVTIPSSMDYLPDWTFSNCTGLTTVHLPDGITSIGYGAFNNTPNLTGITLPASLKTIDQYAFMDDEKLGPAIVIPEGVTSIGNYAFGNCSGIKTITMARATPPEIADKTFTEYTAAVTVPKGAGDAYRNHTIWGRFTNITEK